MLLSEEDKKAIAEAIHKAESTTSGEIVFAVTGQSDHYHHAILQGALIGAALVTALYLAIPLPHSIGLLIWTQIVSFAVFYALVPYLGVRRLLLSSREIEERVRESAFREFYASGLYKTRDSNGVLIYLSLLEHRVVVMGDRGIHEKMGDEHWGSVRDTIIDGIRRGHPAQGIRAAVENCGKALADHFPIKPDDTNELPDQVIDRTR